MRERFRAFNAMGAARLIARLAIAKGGCTNPGQNRRGDIVDGYEI